MDLSTVLNVVVSLLFLYLLLSMMASIVQELVAGYTNARGRALKSAIGHLLGDPGFTGLARTLYDHKLVSSLLPPGLDLTVPKLLVRLAPFLSARLPSYLPKDVFADALIDILARKKEFENGIQHQGIATLWDGAGQDQVAFRNKLMGWYESCCERHGGLYKRRAQVRLLLYGVVIAIGLNVDTLHIASYLWTSGNAAKSAAIAQQAADFYAGSADSAAGMTGASNEENVRRLAEIYGGVAKMELPIGWTESSPAAIVAAIKGSLTPGRIVGWLMTALAISLGSQFWFDLLGKVIGLRGAGRKP